MGRGAIIKGTSGDDAVLTRAVTKLALAFRYHLAACESSRLTWYPPTAPPIDLVPLASVFPSTESSSVLVELFSESDLGGMVGVTSQPRLLRSLVGTIHRRD